MTVILLKNEFLRGTLIGTPQEQWTKYWHSFDEKYEFRGHLIHIYRSETESECELYYTLTYEGHGDCYYSDSYYEDKEWWLHDDSAFLKSPSEALELAVNYILEDDDAPLIEPLFPSKPKTKIIALRAIKTEPKSKKQTKTEKRSAVDRAWSLLVKHRDGNKCTKCNSTNKLHAHHIKQFKDNKTLRLDVSNGVTLCAPCHREHHRVNGR